MRVGSLCTGYGGLDLAVTSVFGGDIIWTGDDDEAAARLITHRWPHAPNLGDIRWVDWSTVEPVDVVTAGWPCQPWSLAGRRRGAADDRDLWPKVARAVRVVRPRLVVMENVPSIAPLGELARAVADLAACGYVGSWARVRASDVGAPHRRERVFLTAADADSDAVRLQPAGQSRCDRPAVAAHPRGQTAADTDGAARGLLEPRRIASGTSQGAGRETGGRTRRGHHPHTSWGVYEPAIRRWERAIGRVAPDPTEPGRRGQPKLSPLFVEWMQGLDKGHVTDVPGLSRQEQLRLLGNGVVPVQAAHAIRLLMPTLEAVA